MATTNKTPVLVPIPNWRLGRILLYEQESGPLPNDVVETQGQNLVAPESSLVFRPYEAEKQQFVHDLQRKLGNLIWLQGL